MELEHKSDVMAAIRAEVPDRSQITSPHDYRAGGWRVDRGEQMKQGRLATARRASDGHHLPVFHAEVKGSQRWDWARINAAHVLNLDGELVGHALTHS